MLYTPTAPNGCVQTVNAASQGQTPAQYFFYTKFKNTESQIFSVAHTAFYKAKISMVQFMCDVLNERAGAYRNQSSTTRSTYGTTTQPGRTYGATRGATATSNGRGGYHTYPPRTTHTTPQRHEESSGMLSVRVDDCSKKAANTAESLPFSLAPFIRSFRCRIMR